MSSGQRAESGEGCDATAELEGGGAAAELALAAAASE